MTLLRPDAARALAVRLLVAEGLRVSAGNARGDSLYLAADGATLLLRVSSHARTARQRARRRDIATSLVIREPRSAAQVAALVASALGAYARACAAGAP